MIGGGGGPGNMGQQAGSAITANTHTSTSQSYTKLNKSANNIVSGSSNSAATVGIAPLTSMRKKEATGPSTSSLS